MAIELYDLTVPVLLRGLDRLAAVLAKGEAHAAAAGMPAEGLVGARLAPDMMTLAGQVQRASDTARLAAVRIGGVENLPMPDEEASFAELQARVARTRAFLEAVPRSALDGREGEILKVRIGQSEQSLSARDYALWWVLPNFFFHVATAYDILRAEGVPLGKKDYIGPMGS